MGPSRARSKVVWSDIYAYIYTSVKIIKNEVGCRDDTVQKNCRYKKALRGGVRACNNLPQPPKTKM